MAAPTGAGELRERIRIRRKTGTGKDPETGAPTGTWSTVAEAYARIRSTNGREALIGQVLLGVSYFEIVVRYRDDILPSDQIIWLTSNGRELNVHNAEDRSGRKVWLWIEASTEAPQGAGA